MAATEAYCVKCRQKREIKNPVETTMKNGRPATKGVCPVCGTGLYRIGAGSGTGSAKPAGAGSGAKASSGSKPGAKSSK